MTPSRHVWGFAVLLAPGLVGAQAGSTPFTYAPTTQQYRITTVTKRSQDQSGGRAPFEFTTTTTQYVTLHVARRTPDTLAVAIAVDSLRVTSTLDAMPPDTAGFRGVTLRGTISPQGHVYTFDAPAGTPPGKVTALYRAFRPFLVPFPASAMAPGLSWTDSTVDHTDRKPFNITSTSVTTWTVTGDTIYAGQHAWRVERVAIITTAGDGTEGVAPVHIAGDETVRAVRYVTASGLYIGGTATQTGQIQLTTTNAGPDQSEGTPLRQTIKTTVEPISPLHTADR